MDQTGKNKYTETSFFSIFTCAYWKLYILPTPSIPVCYSTLILWHYFPSFHIYNFFSGSEKPSCYCSEHSYLFNQYSLCNQSLDPMRPLSQITTFPTWALTFGHLSCSGSKLWQEEHPQLCLKTLSSFSGFYSKLFRKEKRRRKMKKRKRDRRQASRSTVNILLLWIPNSKIKMSRLY